MNTATKIFFWSAGLLGAGAFFYYRAANEVQFSIDGVQLDATGTKAQLRIKATNPSKIFGFPVPQMVVNIFDNANTFIGTVTNNQLQWIPSNATSFIYGDIEPQLQGLIGLVTSVINTGSLPTGVIFQGIIKVGSIDIHFGSTAGIGAVEKGGLFNELVYQYDQLKHRGSPDKEKREKIERVLFKRYNASLYIVRNWVNEGGDSMDAYIGFDEDKARHIFDSYKNDRIEDFAHKEQMWELSAITDNGEPEIIDSNIIPPVNDTTESLLYEVQNHYGGKYTLHYLPEYKDYLQLRIADHSGKHRNTTGPYLSIVIANDNVTERFRRGPEGMSHEHYFDDSWDAKSIIEEINRLMDFEGVGEEDA